MNQLIAVVGSVVWLILSFSHFFFWGGHWIWKPALLIPGIYSFERNIYWTPSVFQSPSKALRIQSLMGYVSSNLPGSCSLTLWMLYPEARMEICAGTCENTDHHGSSMRAVTYLFCITLSRTHNSHLIKEWMNKWIHLNQTVLPSKISWKEDWGVYSRKNDREGHSNYPCPYVVLSLPGLEEPSGYY